MTAKEAFADALGKNLDKITAAVLKKIEEPESTKTTTSETGDKTSEKKSTEADDKTNEKKSIETVEKNSDVDIDDLVNKLVDKIVPVIKGKLDKKGEEENEDDVKKNLVEILAKAGVDPENYEITVKEVKTGAEINTESKLDKEIVVTKDNNNRPVIAELDNLEPEDRKKALDEYLLGIIQH